MASAVMNHNDAGKSQRLELIKSVLGQVFGSTVKCNVKSLAWKVEADDC